MASSSIQKRIVVSAVLSAAATLGLVPTAHAQDFHDTVVELLQHWDAPGAVVSVVHNGEAVFHEGFGATMLGGGVPVTKNTLAPVQSITKSFTAVVLSMLVQDGILGWDDPVKTHIPEFDFGGPYLSRHITIRDLMTHRSGLPSLIGEWEPSEFAVADVLRALKDEEPTIPLRSGVYYSQVGMALLGEVVNRVSGMSWSEYVDQRVLGPLQMTNSFPNDERMAARHGDPPSVTDLLKTVTSHEGELQDAEWQRYNEMWAPAAAVITNAGDMTRYMRFLLGGGRVEGRSVLRADLIDEMFTPTEIPGVDGIAEWEPIIAPTTDVFSYGLGFQVYEDHGRLIVEHGGAGRSTASMALMPEEGLGVFVVTNASYAFDSARLVSSIKHAAFEHFLGLPQTDWIEFWSEGR